MARRVTDRDLGLKALRRRLRDAGRFEVTVGIHPKEGAVPHENGNGITVATIGTIHEFGVGVPERSWLRAPLDNDRTAIRAAMKRQARTIVSNRSRKRADAALDFVGRFIVARIKAHIGRNIPPPLADATIERKGDDLALVETSQFLDAIKHKVVQ